MAPPSAQIPPGNFWSLWQLRQLSRSVQVADHPETRNRWAGSVQESLSWFVDNQVTRSMLSVRQSGSSYVGGITMGVNR